MAPSPDMFELGAKVQVLKRGTLYASRASLLYDLYRKHRSLEQLSATDRERLEGEIFKGPIDQVWRDTEEYFRSRNPVELDRAAQNPKHRMALVFRWYLGKSSRWAIAGDTSRKSDAQIWCGPCIGSFNAWTAGTFLADPAERRIGVVAANLLAGAALVRRARILEAQGVALPDGLLPVRPRRVRAPSAAHAAPPGELRV